MQLFANNASSTLAAGITTAATSVTLAAGTGAKFPNPLNGDYFLVTLFQRVGITEQNWEIVMCTARAGDVLTIQRAQEGTTAFAFNAGDLIEARLTAGSVLPVRNGALTSALNEAPAVGLASASSMVIGAVSGNTIAVTGTTTINAFDSVGAGAVRRMKFGSALTITHNAASMKCIGGASIVTQAGDWCEWISLGGGNWEMMSYTRASGGSLVGDSTKAGLGANTFTAAQSFVVIDKGIVSTGTVTFTFSASNVQRLEVGGALTIALNGIPANGIFAELLIKLVNGGSAAVTFPGIEWILPNGTTTTSFPTYMAAIGRTALQTASGADFIYLWTNNGGAQVYGKLL